MIKVKNNKETSDTWVGQLIEPTEYYEIEKIELFRWQTNSKVLADIASGDLVVNNDIEDILDVSKAINFLLEKDPSPRDSDGSVLNRTKVTSSGWAFQIHGIEFKTSQLDSVNSNKINNTPYGFASLKCFKDNGLGTNTLVLCEDQADADANAIVTQLDWEPTHDYEIMGGMLKQLASPAEDIRLWVVGVPDVPENYGGSKVFATNINLRYLDGTGVRVDGRAPKYLTYNSTLHTNKLRLHLRHPAGFKHSLLMIFEFFKA